MAALCSRYLFLTYSLSVNTSLTLQVPCVAVIKSQSCKGTLTSIGFPVPDMLESFMCKKFSLSQLTVHS